MKEKIYRNEKEDEKKSCNKTHTNCVLNVYKNYTVHTYKAQTRAEQSSGNEENVADEDKKKREITNE